MRVKQIAYDILIVMLSLVVLMACRYARLYGVVEQSCTSDCRRSDWECMGRAWYEEVTDQKAHNAAAFRQGGSFVGVQIEKGALIDAVFEGGRDHQHIDSAQVGLLFLHGARLGGSRWNAKFGPAERVGENFVSQERMRFGDANLDFLHLSSCHSLDEAEWRYWWETFQGLHQVNGFHGAMQIGSQLINDYRSFARDSFSYAIAFAWIDNMYYSNAFLRNKTRHDQCPVSYAVGTSADDALLRISSESYSNTMADPDLFSYQHLQEATWVALYVEDCDPESAAPIGHGDHWEDS